MAKNTLTFTATTRTVKTGDNIEKSITEYISEYEGNSGVLHVKQAKAGKTRIYADAGEGYFILQEIEDAEFMRILNMAGFDSVKIVCSEEVEFGIVNEF